MLKKFSDLLGRAEPVAALEEELDQLSAEGSRILAAAEADESAAEALEDADAILAALARAKAGRNRLKRIDVEIAATRERLDIARSEARRAELQAMRAAYAKAARAYLAAATSACEAFSQLVAAREAFPERGFSVEQAAIPVPPSLAGHAFLAPDLLENFAAELGRAALGDSFKLPRRIATPAIRLTQPHARPALFPARMIDPEATAAADARAAAERGAALERARVRRAPLDEPAGPGEIRLQVLRSGIEHDRLGPLLVGDIIAAPLALSPEMLRSGAYEPAPQAAATPVSILPAESETEKDQAA